MTSSVTHIEVSPVRDVRTDDETLTVTLSDGRVIVTPLDWYPRLAHATPQERSRWESNGDGDAIHWPDVDEDISVEGLIAGRKSGECATSLKQWLAIQEQLRQSPPRLRELRRELLRTGPMTAAQIAKRVRQTVEAWDTQPSDWVVGRSADAVTGLDAMCVAEDSSAVAFQAVDETDARAAEQACRDLGMGGAPAGGGDGTASAQQVFVCLTRDLRRE